MLGNGRAFHVTFDDESVTKFTLKEREKQYASMPEHPGQVAVAARNGASKHSLRWLKMLMRHDYWLAPVISKRKEFVRIMGE